MVVIHYFMYLQHSLLDVMYLQHSLLDVHHPWIWLVKNLVSKIQWDKIWTKKK